MTKIFVIKRDGRKAEFNVQKIYKAINAAYLNTFNTDVPDEEKVLEITNKTVRTIKRLKKNELTVNEIQDIVEDVLIKMKEIDMAKQYIGYRSKRDQVREASSQLILDYKKLTFSDSSEVDAKRENANVNGNTAMGTMLQYGSTGSKHFALNNIFKKEQSEAHKSGAIHIHDLDFAAMGTTTCLSDSTWIKVKDNKGNIKNCQIKEFNNLFKNNSINPEWQDVNNTFILGRNGWTKLVKMMRRKSSTDDNFYFLKTRMGLGLKVTEKHNIPIIRDGKELLLEVKDINIGDELLSSPKLNEDYTDTYVNMIDALSNYYENEKLQIVNLKKLKQWLLYKHDIKSLQKEICPISSRNGGSCGYITLKQLAELKEKFIIPYEVLITLEIKYWNSRYTLPVLLPITNELAKLFGYIYSDGCIPNRTTHQHLYDMTFINADMEKLANFKDCFIKTFNSKISVRKTDGKQSGWIIANELIANLFGRVLGYKSCAENIRIPDFIMNGSDEIKYSFISAAVDGDGCLTNEAVEYNTVCEEFIQQLVILLKSLNIDAYYDKQIIKGTNANFEKETIRNFDSYRLRVGTAESVSKLANKLNGVKQSELLKNRASNVRGTKYVADKITDKILLDNEEYYYDIETAEHWFMANGYIVHNCTQLNLTKLFHNGFSTGHGYLREPNDIMSYAALAAIAIQSNQNK